MGAALVQPAMEDSKRLGQPSYGTKGAPVTLYNQHQAWFVQAYLALRFAARSQTKGRVSEALGKLRVNGVRQGR